VALLRQTIEQEEIPTAAANKAAEKTARGRAQERAKVAGRQKYEVSYEATTGRSAPGREKGGQEVR
jgi:hypothetical protein